MAKLPLFIMFAHILLAGYAYGQSGKIFPGFSWNPFIKENKEIKKGNNLYKKGKLKEALKKYQQATAKHHDSPVVHFNTGAALYKLAMKDETDRQQRLKDAEAEFMKAIDMAGEEDKTIKARSFYNLGNVYAAEQRWDDAIAAYRQCLKLIPGDEKVAFNLAVALKRRQEEKKKEEEEKKKKQQNQQNDEQKQCNKDGEQNNQQNQDEGEQQQGHRHTQQENQKGDSGQSKKNQQKQIQQKQSEQHQNRSVKTPHQKEQKQQRAVPLTKQQTEAILNALERNEKNYQIEALRRYLKGKPRVLKDW